MTHEEWLDCTDVPAMLEVLWDAKDGGEPTFTLRMHRYLVACCRRIWKLLPQEGNRRGIEVAECYLTGWATDTELQRVSWGSEGAAFIIDYNCYPDSIKKWVDDVQALPPDELANMLIPPGAILEINARHLLLQAAYFADLAARYPLCCTEVGLAEICAVSVS